MTRSPSLLLLLVIIQNFKKAKQKEEKRSTPKTKKTNKQTQAAHIIYGNLIFYSLISTQVMVCLLTSTGLQKVTL